MMMMFVTRAPSVLQVTRAIGTGGGRDSGRSDESAHGTTFEKGGGSSVDTRDGNAFFLGHDFFITAHGRRSTAKAQS